MMIVMNGTTLTTDTKMETVMPRIMFMVHMSAVIDRHNEAGRPISGAKK